MVFGYVRVSTREQNTDRQEIALREWGVDPKCIYLDRQFGRLRLLAPETFGAVYELWSSGELTLTSACKRLGVSHQTFERWVRERTDMNQFRRSQQNEQILTSNPPEQR